MSTQNDNLVVKLVKKAVGLPTGAGCACGTATPAPTAARGGGGDATSDAGPITPTQVHQVVRERYGEIARTRNTAAETAGCGCSSPRLYTDELLADLPTSVADLSLGCGDPVSLADIRPGDTVLDLGSGGGLDCFLAAKRVGPTGQVIGVDMTLEMLERARASATRLNAINVEFRQGQIEALPVADRTVDVVLSNCVINLSPDKQQVFREMFRVLKSGGRVSVSDIVTSGPMSPLMAKNMESWAACVAGAWEARAYQAGLQAAGFVEVAVTSKEGLLNTLSAQTPAGMPFSALITAHKP